MMRCELGMALAPARTLRDSVAMDDADFEGLVRALGLETAAALFAAELRAAAELAASQRAALVAVDDAAVEP